MKGRTCNRRRIFTSFSLHECFRKPVKPHAVSRTLPPTTIISKIGCCHRLAPRVHSFSEQANHRARAFMLFDTTPTSPGTNMPHIPRIRIRAHCYIVCWLMCAASAVAAGTGYNLEIALKLFPVPRPQAGSEAVVPAQHHLFIIIHVPFVHNLREKEDPNHNQRTWSLSEWVWWALVLMPRTWQALVPHTTVYTSTKPLPNKRSKHKWGI